MKNRIQSVFILMFLLVSFSEVKAQAIFCNVQVISPSIQNSDKQVFETLQKEITEFMNNRIWTNEQFLNQERIECSFLINISERPNTDEFIATIQVQARRPVYKSSYYTNLINFLDENFTFKYVEFEPIDFNEQSYTNTLSSTLAYYANIILGMDYDTFSPNGGEPFFIKAQNIVSNAQVAKEGGWKAFEGTKNRYWLVENLLNPQLKGMHEVYYKYHRLGLDVMSENMTGGRTQIFESLKMLQSINNSKSGTLVMQLFFTAKSDEIINVFSEAFPDEKSGVYNVLNQTDPGNMIKYQKLLK